MIDVERELQERELSVPMAEKCFAGYVPVNSVGNLVFDFRDCK